MANQVVKLKSGSNYLYPYGDFMGVNITNCIYSNSSFLDTTWTASQDCWIRLRGAGNNGTISVYLNNVLLHYLGTNSPAANSSGQYQGLWTYLAIKKGDIVKSSGGGSYRSCYLDAYGVHY